MTAGQQSLLKNQTMFSVLHDREHLPDEHERVPGYLDALTEALDRIVIYEREKLSAAIQIQKKVDSVAHDLAKVLIRADWKPSQ